MEPVLITVIVAVYNVEKYLNKCIESIISQTYHNLEIILVDDGSTDDSGKIIDNYAQNDKRIVPLHKENGGQGEARNFALDIAKGEYISFVDGDDYLAEDYIEYLYQLKQKYDADISACTFKKIYRDDEELDDINDEICVLNTYEALEELLYQRRVIPGPVCKLYRKELFNNVRYPKGIYYEDLAVIYKLLEKCNNLIIGTKQKYYYVQRTNSTMRGTFNLKKLHRLLVANEMKEYLDEKYPILSVATSTRCFIAGLQLYREIPRGKAYNEYRNEAWEQIRKYRLNAIKDKNAKLSTRIMAVCTYFGQNVLTVLGSCYTALVVK